MDLESLIKLEKLYKPLFLVPLGNASILKQNNLSRVQELDWWESAEIGGLKITVTSAQHWSGRGLRDRFEALWCGFYLQFSNKKIFWAGDTGYGPHFDEIRESSSGFKISSFGGNALWDFSIDR